MLLIEIDKLVYYRQDHCGVSQIDIYMGSCWVNKCVVKLIRDNDGDFHITFSYLNIASILFLN